MFQQPIQRVALVNPRWGFEGSQYWACRESHLPLELLYAEALLTKAGFSALVVDAHLEELSLQAVAARIDAFAPNLIAVTTAPTYLFWRCPQPELEVPRALCKVLREIAPVVAVGPHGSATPRYVLDQLGCWAVIRGEPEEELVRLAQGRPSVATFWSGRPNRGDSHPVAAVDVGRLPALEYRQYPFELRTHRHHLFSGEGRGAEVEFTRGCPYSCSFCNRRFFRNRYRERSLEKVLTELRRLKSRGIDYVYFIDEVFGLGRSDLLLRALTEERLVQFGCQTRIDLWSKSRLDSLSRAGCVSIEFGLESPFPEVQDSLNKGYRMEGDRILELMVHAKARIPWVQGDLVQLPGAKPQLRLRTEQWRQEAIAEGVWISEPVPLFPYPGSDLHEEMFGPLNDESWIKAAERNPNFS